MENRAHMRLPDLSGLTLAPAPARTGTEAAFRHCNPTTESRCVTYLPNSLLLARNPDEVKQFSITEDECGVRLAAPAEDEDLSKVGPYDTLYQSAWWKLLMQEMRRDRLEVYLTYWISKKGGGGEWRGLYTYWKWDEVLPRLQKKGGPASPGHMELRIQPLPNQDEGLGLKLLLGMFKANLLVLSAVANERHKSVPTIASKGKSKRPRAEEPPKQPRAKDPPKQPRAKEHPAGPALFAELVSGARERELAKAKAAARKARKTKDNATPKAPAPVLSKEEAEMEAALEEELAREDEGQTELEGFAPAPEPLPRVRLKFRQPEPPAAAAAPEESMDVETNPAVRAAFEEFMQTTAGEEQLPEAQAWTLEEIQDLVGSGSP